MGAIRLTFKRTPVLAHHRRTSGVCIQFLWLALLVAMTVVLPAGCSSKGPHGQGVSSATLTQNRSESRVGSGHSNFACGLAGVPDGVEDYFKFGLGHPGNYASISKRLNEQVASGELDGVCSNRMVALAAGSDPRSMTIWICTTMSSQALVDHVSSATREIARESLSFLYMLAYTLGDLLHHEETAGLRTEEVSSEALSMLADCARVEFWSSKGLGRRRAGTDTAATRACVGGLLRAKSVPALAIARQRVAALDQGSNLSQLQQKSFRRKIEALERELEDRHATDRQR